MIVPNPRTIIATYRGWTIRRYADGLLRAVLSEGGPAISPGFDYISDVADWIDAEQEGA